MCYDVHRKFYDIYLNDAMFIIHIYLLFAIYSSFDASTEETL